MELLFLILFTFISASITLLIFSIYLNYSHSKLPPGPWQLPIIGNLHQLFMASSSLPHRIFHKIAKTYGNPHFIHLKLGEVSLVVASSSQAAREIFKTHDITFSARPLFEAMKIITYEGKTVSFSPYGHYWRQRRKICVSELTSTKRVQSFASIREDEVGRLIGSIVDCTSNSNINSGGHQVQLWNVNKMLTKMTNNIMTRSAVGNSCNEKERTEFIEAIIEASDISSGFSFLDVFPSWSSLLGFFSGFKRRLEKCHRRIDQVIDSTIQQRRSNAVKQGQEQLQVLDEIHEEDLLDVLLRLQQDGSSPLGLDLTDDCIKAVILDMFAAGTEPSSTIVAWAMSELMRNPRVMRKVQSEVRAVLQGRNKVTEADVKELNYMQLVIKETLRLHPPGPILLPRECQEKCEILGYEIPHKARVVANVWALGRDPRYWVDPETFMPERFEEKIDHPNSNSNSNSNPLVLDFKGASYEFLPFGSGRRICPGILMGLAMVDLPLAQLLYYFNWELPQGIEPHNLDMEETFGVAARRKTDLYLRPTLYITPFLAGTTA